MKFFDPIVNKLEASLDLRLERQNILASNVANADTPGYVPQDLDFAKAMAQAESAMGFSANAIAGPSEGAGGTEGGGGSAETPHAVMGAIATSTSHPLSSAAGFDGNRVDGDQAAVSLAENSLQYGASAQAVSKKLAILLYAANDGTS